MRRLSTLFLLVLALLLLPVLGVSEPQFVAAHDAVTGFSQRAVRDADQADVHSSPIMFIENTGQFDEETRFQVFGASETMWLAQDGWWMTMWQAEEGTQSLAERVRHANIGSEAPRQGVHLKFSFVGANRTPRIEPFNRLDTRISYFMGNEADKWQPDLPVWGGVRYKNLYPGIDLELTSEEGQVVQRLVVVPEANLDAVRLQVDGADEVELLPSLSKSGRNGTSEALLSTAIGELALPLLDVVTTDGTALEPNTQAEVKGNEINAPFAAHSRRSSQARRGGSRTAPTYSTFLGGNDRDSSLALAVDESGNAYVMGSTASTTFPATVGAFDSSYNENLDLFVAKLNSDGSGLIYATFLGGSGVEDGFANNLVVDGAGHAYITGHTSSTDFPITSGVYDSSYNGGDNDSFVAKLNPDGTGLFYATFLGGSGSEPYPRIGIDESGNAYVTGRTTSSDFPTTSGAFDESHNGDYDAFVTKLNSTGTALTYSTFLGGADYDAGHDVEVVNDEAFVVGAAGYGFPTTADSFDPIYNGCNKGTALCDAFVVKLNTTGSGLVYGTYMGGSRSDWFNDLAVSPDGTVSATGPTESNDFPMYPKTYDATSNGGVDTVVAQLSPTGMSLHFSTYFGGSFDDYGNEIAIDHDGSLVIAGGTLSPDMPLTSDAMRSGLGGGQDAYVMRLRSDGRTLLYSSFLGGSGPDWALGLDQDATGAFYLTGYTDSSDFPISAGAFDPSYDGAYDAFVSKLTVGNGSSIVPDSPSTDVDGDGLLNETELNGWSNGAGSFTTDPNDADSDDDGLLDGEEQRFDSHPNNDKSPGIYVVYDDNFKTKEYFGWTQHGSSYMALESAIIRRGSIFSVGGPAGATIQVDKSMPSLSTLTPERNAASGRWEIPIAPNNTVGQYTITLTEGAWSKSLTLNVIFEMPTNLDQQHLGAYLYNDDRNDYRDEISIWFATVEVDNPQTDWQHTAYGYGLWFYNHQYQSYVFEHVIAAINGTTSQEEAIQKLGEQVDELTRFDPTYFYFSMYDVLHSYEDRNQCSNIAAALTSFSRSAGIPARPVAVDWDRYILGGDYFDTATEVWLSGDWKTMRAYNVFTGGEDAPNPIKGGIVSAIDRRTWGNVHYPDSYSDIVAVAAPNWEYAHLSQYNPVSRWDNATPNDIWKWPWVETTHIPYWGWANEPTRIGDPLALMRPRAERSSKTGPRGHTVDSQNKTVAFTDNYSDSGVDSDGNGLFDSLALELELNVSTAGSYTIIGALADSSAGNLSKKGAIVASKLTTDLSVGVQTVQLLFDGKEIFINGQNGPYQVQELLISHSENATPGDLQNSVLDSRREIYNTTAYSYTAFETPGANLTAEYSDSGVDNNNNNRYEHLAVNVGLNISTSDTYTVSAELYDRNDNTGNLLATATWSGSDSSAELQFDGPTIYRHAVNGPYYLRNLRLQNSAGEIIASVDNAHETSAYPYRDFEGPAVIFTDVYSDKGVDSNKNTLYNYLAIQVQVKVAEPGEYAIEGWLTDKEEHSVTWASSGTTTLGVGDHFLELKFDGQTIRANQVNGKFTLSGLKVIERTQNLYLDQRNVATTTEHYDFQQFEDLNKIYIPVVIR